MHAPQAPEEVDELVRAAELGVEAEQHGDLGVGRQRGLGQQERERGRLRPVEERAPHGLPQRRQPALRVVELGRVVVALEALAERRAALVRARPPLELVFEPDEPVALAVLGELSTSLCYLS